MLNKLVELALKNNPELIGMEDVVEKEILHHDIMSVLHHQGILQRLTFIGGTSLRLCYDSSRLSEDLDFTAGVDFKPESFSGLGEELQLFLERKYGLNVNVYEPRLSSTNTSTWKVTIEKHSNRPDLPSQKMHIDVCSLPSFDIEHRPLIDHYGIKSQMSGLPIPVQSLNEIQADKMIAFAYRERRIKPRDVWDIVWLTQQRAQQNVELVIKKLAARKKDYKEFINLLQKHTELIVDNGETKNDFHQEMSRFLPASVSERTVQQDTFWKYFGTIITEEVKQLVDMLNGEGDSPKFKM
jgi:predicted nucleotidyltransferase component of viral defense system